MAVNTGINTLVVAIVFSIKGVQDSILDIFAQPTYILLLNTSRAYFGSILKLQITNAAGKVDRDVDDIANNFMLV